MRGKRAAIVMLLKYNPEAFGSVQPFAAITEAKLTRVKAKERYSLTAAEQEECDRAEEFLEQLGEALLHVPEDARTRAMLQHCADLKHHLEAARPIIMATPRADRSKSSVVARLAKQTRLSPEIVEQFLKKPKTRALGFARKLTAKAFSVSSEHLRKLQRTQKALGVKPSDLVLLGSTRKHK